jgi:hypothetical protein
MVFETLLDDQRSRSYGERKRSQRAFWLRPDENGNHVESVDQIGGIRLVLANVGLKFANLRPGPNPPDCEAEIDGKLCGIEDTLLVETMGERIDGDYCYRAWSREELLNALRAIIRRKDDTDLNGDSYARYILVVRTDEFHLDPNTVTTWFRGEAFRVNMITDVLFAMSYWRGWGKGCGYPVFPLSLVRG